MSQPLGYSGDVATAINYGDIRSHICPNCPNPLWDSGDSGDCDNVALCVYAKALVLTGANASFYV